MAYKFTRAIYKQIKKYDKEDMEAYIEGVYLKGFNDAGRSKGLDKIRAIEKLKTIKGLGEKTINKVISCLYEDL